MTKRIITIDVDSHIGNKLWQFIEALKEYHDDSILKIEWAE